MTINNNDKKAGRDIYPHVVICYIPGYYARMPIKIISDEKEKKQYPRIITLLWKGKEPARDADGIVTPRCRATLVQIVNWLVKSTGYRMCLVLGAEDCEYVEPDGSVRHSNEPPSMTIHLASGDARLDIEMINGKVTDVQATPVR